MGVILSDEEIRRLQDVCLELLLVVDKICRDHSIQYTLEGGTLIGAVREGGFLKWDDDADISMTREEYEKFLKACETDLDKDLYFVQEHRTDPEYPWGYSKIRKNGTSLIAIGQEHLKFRDGIFVDIFVYDNVPDSFFARRLHYLACTFIRKCQYATVGRRKEKNAFLRFVFSIMDSIPKKRLFKWLNKLSQKANKKSTILMRHYTFPYFRKECIFGLPSKCFSEYIDIMFEGHPLRVMKDFDTFLTLKYGDYMTPPKQDEIKRYPISSIRFSE